ncbi:hypothetical protein SARC_04320 [Sphaeroforma arctica JP610]|uniref:Uncharacterized protein n=1 Tax=Sphaeroforma arctica JP610 TaxID=667725 RepID=A0A0L0G591_9EUKA|nr:hypothetical protein SARC_04320 [Sphaeroforma arctica JP610]KNC83433.1 hypothetical protein SARC_04320 [Sphaeroforma arctica JP610]|eukprot:XP_014157335.1 hypothetical protein SARC_04320 [Sphaeroforma arctica JP610]
MASEWDSEDSDSPILASYYSPERQADTKLAYFETMNEGPLWGVSLSDKLETPKPTARRLQSSNGFEKCFKSPFDLYFSTKDMCCIPMDCDELSTVISVQNIANIPFISISPNISAAARKKFHSGADGTIIGTVSKADRALKNETMKIKKVLAYPFSPHVAKESISKCKHSRFHTKIPAKARMGRIHMTVYGNAIWQILAELWLVASASR